MAAERSYMAEERGYIAEECGYMAEESGYIPGRAGYIFPEECGYIFAMVILACLSCSAGHTHFPRTNILTVHQWVLSIPNINPFFLQRANQEAGSLRCDVMYVRGKVCKARFSYS
jgi:hypothetical protein